MSKSPNSIWQNVNKIRSGNNSQNVLTLLGNQKQYAGCWRPKSGNAVQDYYKNPLQLYVTDWNLRRMGYKVILVIESRYFPHKVQVWICQNPSDMDFCLDHHENSILKQKRCDTSVSGDVPSS